jgi:hypothetical protein
VKCKDDITDVRAYASCAYMQFAVIYTSFAVMGYKALHGVTYFLGCHVEILLSAVVTGSADIFLWERAVLAGLVA